MANTYIQRSVSSSNRRTWTWSGWVKRSKLGSSQYLVESWANSTNYGHLYFSSGDILAFYAPPAGTWTWHPKFRDTNAWYHIVLRCDTTLATNADRVRLYVNGELQSANAVAGINQNQELNFNVGGHMRFGARTTGSSDFFDGYGSHFHFCDGYSYAPTEFGETDSTTGEWKIKTSPNVSYGTNGYWLFKDGNNLSGSTVQDQSGQSNDYTLTGGTLTNTEDCPSNVFATMNPLSNNDVYAFSNGNLRCTHSGQWEGSNSTLGMISGKWYWEVKYISGNVGIGIGQMGNDATATGNNSSLNIGYAGRSSRGYELFKNGSNSQKINNNSASSYGTVPSANDIYMVAFDADIGAIWVGKNGTWFDSATEAEIEAGTTTNAMYSNLNMDEHYLATGSIESGELQFNFGNGYFATTAISSEGTNASGIGKFEYDVPDGFTALSTKGLNE
jgi:hypothetical protein